MAGGGLIGLRRLLIAATTGAALVPLASCAPPPAVIAPAPGPDRAEVAQAISRVAAQVKRCYHRPRVPHEGRQIVTTVRVRFAADGTLLGLPETVAQAGVTPANSVYAPAMARAAGEAIIRCAPYNLPAALYQGGWDDFELTFSPRAIA